MTFVFDYFELLHFSAASREMLYSRLVFCHLWVQFLCDVKVFLVLLKC